MPYTFWFYRYWHHPLRRWPTILPILSLSLSTPPAPTIPSPSYPCHLCIHSWKTVDVAAINSALSDAASTISSHPTPFPFPPVYTISPSTHLFLRHYYSCSTSTNIIPLMLHHHYQHCLLIRFLHRNYFITSIAIIFPVILFLIHWCHLLRCHYHYFYAIDTSLIVAFPIILQSPFFHTVLTLPLQSPLQNWHRRCPCYIAIAIVSTLFCHWHHHHLLTTSTVTISPLLLSIPFIPTIVSSVGISYTAASSCYHHRPLFFVWH